MTAKIIRQIVIGIVLVFLTLPIIKRYYFNLGLRWQYIFLFSLISAYFITPFCRMVALKLNIMDTPDWRKIHKQSTPLMGGLAIYLAFTASLLLNNVFLPGMKIILSGATILFFIGLFDDVHPLPALLKIIFQTLISLVIIIAGDIQLTFFQNFMLAHTINIFLTLLWIVGLTNAMNFFDGMDGLATSISILTSAFLGIIAFNTNQPALGWFAVALIGSCIGFLPYNFRLNKSALLFLGDAGSTFLGFTLAGLAVLGEWSNTSHYVSLTAPLLIFGVLIFDMIYVNISRIKMGLAKNFFELLTCVNTDHLHHRLFSMGFSAKEVVFTISTLSTCMGVSALIIMNQRFIEAILGLFQALLILGLIVVLMIKGGGRTPKEGDRRIFFRRKTNHVEYRENQIEKEPVRVKNESSE